MPFTWIAEANESDVVQNTLKEENWNILAGRRYSNTSTLGLAICSVSRVYKYAC